MPTSKTEIESTIGPGGSNETEFKTMEQIDVPESPFPSNVDINRVNLLEEQIASKKEEIKTKVYAITMTKEIFESYADFMENKSEWSGTEALGIREVNKQIQKIKSEGGVKNFVISLSVFPLEASHYFISKSRGTGLKEAESFLTIYKAIDQALGDAKKDASAIKDLEKELAAAMQGIEIE